VTTSGGSGVVIIRTLESAVTAVTTATLTVTGGFKVYTFTASGTIGWVV
jgi:hypothetical protein